MPTAIASVVAPPRDLVAAEQTALRATAANAKAPVFVMPVKTELTTEQASSLLSEAYQRVTGEPPTPECAALLTAQGTPVVALTIRHDRLDNFWFTLLHECAHVVRHLAGSSAARTQEYFDDLDVEGATDPREREADTFARESLVPSAQWQASAVAFAPSADAAVALADEVGVSPAVVAGRVRHEKRNFRLLGPLVGAGKVRRLFPEVRFD